MISSLTHWWFRSMSFNFHILWIFWKPPCFKFLVTKYCVYKRHYLSLLKFVNTVSWPNVQSVLAWENCVFAAVEWNVLHMSIMSIYSSKELLNSTISLLIFCLDNLLLLLVSCLSFLPLLYFCVYLFSCLLTFVLYIYMCQCSVCVYA